MDWGNFEVRLVSDGKFWLDGGAMFGVVPRVFWEKTMSPDEKNRIQLGLNCLLVRTDEVNVLIDTGCGHKYTEKEMQIYGFDREKDLLTELAGISVAPEDIGLVVNTHLHFDHCGGNTVRKDGEVVPAFPNATYVINAREYESAQHPNERNRASYFEHNWYPIVERGQLRFTAGDEEIFPGIHVVHTPGHTEGHQSVMINSQGKVLFYFGDLCPTAAHVPLPWIMSYDLYPLTTLETRKKIYPQAVGDGWMVFFEHDPRHPCGYMQEDGNGYSVRLMEWEG